jgi:hypothetical protein
MRARAVTVEAAIVLLLGAGLAAASVGLLLYGGAARAGFGSADLLGAGVAGVVVAALVRVAIRMHRRWSPVVGGITAAVLLCALASLAGALIVLIPGECPGAMVPEGRCGIKDAASWGEVAGLATLLNFTAAGLFLMVFRGARSTVRGGAAATVRWARRLKTVRRHGAGRPAPPRGPQDPKGRPTPKRADAERARRRRLRASA